MGSSQEEGHQVNFKTFRSLGHGNARRQVKLPIGDIRANRLSEAINPRGGEVIVTVETKDGERVRGVSRCSRNDNFVRKVGIQIALKRALEQVSSKTDGIKQVLEFCKESEQ